MIASIATSGILIIIGVVGFLSGFAIASDFKGVGKRVLWNAYRRSDEKFFTIYRVHAAIIAVGGVLLVVIELTIR